MQVIKRDGNLVSFDHRRILNAIMEARNSINSPVDDMQIVRIANAVHAEISKHEKIGVEEIQDAVEQALMNAGLNDIAKHYMLYRQEHAIRRKAKTHLMETYEDIFFANSKDVDLKRDNANINTDAPMGIMLKLGAEGAKYFVDNYVLSEEYLEADKQGYIHIHDKDFSLITFNCCQIDLLKLFQGGFSTGHGFLREPNSIRAYASLACIAIQSNQNDMFGGQSINAFDYAMAEGVRKSFRKAILNEVKDALFYSERNLLSDEYEQLTKEINGDSCCYGNSKTVDVLNSFLHDTYLASKIYAQACSKVEEETHQAMEALIHNFNTLHSRAGAQVPFSSINHGMDTSPEGRLVIREVLNAIYAGLGNGETPIFPISVFQLKSGVNYNANDPNFDLPSERETSLSELLEFRRTL